MYVTILRLHLLLLTQISSTDKRIQKNIDLVFLEANTIECLNIEINDFSCEITLQLYSEDLNVNIEAQDMNVLVSNGRPHCS